MRFHYFTLPSLALTSLVMLSFLAPHAVASTTDSNAAEDAASGMAPASSKPQVAANFPTLILGKSQQNDADARACLDLADIAKIRACAEKYRPHQVR